MKKLIKLQNGCRFTSIIRQMVIVAIVRRFGETPIAILDFFFWCMPTKAAAFR